MRLSDLFETSTNYKLALAQAKADGFDMSKRWFHGTHRDFLVFRDRTPEDDRFAWDAMGRGIYLASTKELAERYTRDDGYILTCLIRKGPLVDFYMAAARPDENMMKLMYQGYSEVSQNPERGLKRYNNFEEYVQDYRQHKIKFTGNGGGWFNECLSAAGFIGGYDRYSDLPGPVVIFKKEDVRIIRRQRLWKW